MLCASLACDGAAGSRDSVRVTEVPSATVALADDYLRALGQASPETATRLDLPGADHGGLRDNSEAGLARWHAEEDRLLSAVQAVTVDARHADRVVHGVLLDELARSAAARVCRYEWWGVFSYVNGWQASLTDLARVQPVGTDALREAALRRARAIPRFIDNEIVLLRRGLAAGYSSPRVIVRDVMQQLDGLLAAAPAQSPFATPTQRDATPAFVEAYTAIVRDEINPAIRRYRDFLEREYLAAAREALGVSANPDGRACYDASLREFATMAMPADEVYEIGVRELTRLDEEMRPLAKRLTGQDEVGRAMRMLTSEPRFTFRSAEEIIATAQAAQDRASAAMPRAFGLRTDVAVQIQPYPEFRAKAGAPGQYQAPPEDGSRPPIHLINTWEPTRKSRTGLESTTFHETWPGHHLQVMVARGAKGQHRLLRVLFNSGFGEGYALYAERVADELGLYSGDIDRWGYLASQKFRAARMVVDAGIHTRGLGYEEATALLTEHGTLPPTVVRGEIHRYISWPGQAPSYMIGNLEILRLREEARTRLGDRFDIRSFHDQVLGHGNITLSLLRALVSEWSSR
jgi:uncharacterized protein (DUF885 family)